MKTKTPSLSIARRTGLRRLVTPVFAIGASLVLASLAEAGTLVTFRQGEANEFTETAYTGVSDTMIRAGNSYNYGGSNLLTIGGNYIGLIRFDLSSTAGKIGSVSGATLTLSPRAGVTEGDPISFNVYVINPADAAWKQGDKVSGESTVGEVSWRYLAKGATEETNVPWAGGGSFSSADYDPTPIFSGMFDPTSTAKIVIDIPASVLLDWINNPSGNAGLVIMSSDTTPQSFYQSGYSTLSLRPFLSFEYEPIPEASTAGLTVGAVLAASLFRFFPKKGARP